jgi:hypothetical protein
LADAEARPGLGFSRIRVHVTRPRETRNFCALINTNSALMALPREKFSCASFALCALIAAAQMLLPGEATGDLAITVAFVTRRCS